MVIRLDFRAAAIAVVCLLLCVMCCVATVRENACALEAAAAKSGGTVIIDAGHGGEDGGAIAADGTLEKTLNLDVALRLKEMFELAGWTVCMTREEDVSLCAGVYEKNEDMRTRIAIAERLPGALFISIHFNKFSIEKCNGAQVFYSGNSPESMDLAQCIQRSIIMRLQKDNNRAVKQGDTNSILLRRIKSPAVIVEGGFISNVQELERLKNEDYRSELAYCIFLGVTEYEKGTEVD